MGGGDVLNLEVQGLLDKWSKGVKKWQRRYVKCQRMVLAYYHYHGHPPGPNDEPALLLDLKDVARLEKQPHTLSIELYNAKDERVLMLRGTTFGEYKMWSDVVEAKVLFLREHEDAPEEAMVTRFHTNTCTMLSLMSDEEVEELACSMMDEIFHALLSTLPSSPAAPWETDDDDKDTASLDGEALMSGLGQALDLMEGLGQDLLAELRNTTAAETSKRKLCLRLFQNYYVSLTNHLLSHVGPVLGAESVGVDRLMEHPVASIMGLLSCLKRVQGYDEAAAATAAALRGMDDGGGEGIIKETAASLLSHGGGGLESMLVTDGTLVASIVSLAIRDVERRWLQEVAVLTEWFASTSEATPPSPHVSAVFDTLGGLLSDVQAAQHDDLAEVAAKIRSKVFTNAILFLAGLVPTLPAPHVRHEGDEQVVHALLDDMDTCRERVAIVQKTYLGGSGVGSRLAAEEQVDILLTSVERFMADVGAAALLDHFLRSDQTMPKLLGLLFVHPTWAHGDVTPLLVKTMKHYLDTERTALPAVVRGRFEARVLRTFLVLYLWQFLRVSATGKRFEGEDMLHFMTDENLVREWVDFRSQWTARDARLEQLGIFKAIRVFLVMPLAEGLNLFSDMYVAVAGGHPSLLLHLYDLLRYCLKLRADVPRSDCTTVLVVVQEFMTITRTASCAGGAPSPPVPAAAKVLLDLFPRAGQYHVTGEPWSLEVGEKVDALQEKMMVGITSLVLANNERLRETAEGATTKTCNASPEHKPVMRLPVLVEAGAMADTAAAAAGQGHDEGEGEEGGLARPPEEVQAAPARPLAPAVAEAEVVASFLGNDAQTQPPPDGEALPVSPQGPEPLPEPVPIVAVATPVESRRVQSERREETQGGGDAPVPSSPSASSSASNPFGQEEEEEEEEEERDGVHRITKEEAGSAARTSPRFGIFRRREQQAVAAPAPHVTPALPMPTRPPPPPAPISPEKASRSPRRMFRNPFADEEDTPRIIAQGRSAPPPPPPPAPARRRFGGGGAFEETSETVVDQQPPAPPPQPQQPQPPSPPVKRRTFGGGEGW